MPLVIHALRAHLRGLANRLDGLRFAAERLNDLPPGTLDADRVSDVIAALDDAERALFGLMESTPNYESED